MGARTPQRRISADATTPLLLLALAFWAGTTSAALATTCYLELGSKLILGSSDSACGVVNDTSLPLTCCAVGDVCLGHNICQVPTGPRGPGHSGYYLGGCNDPNFKDPACTTHCTSNLLPDVVYNSTTKQWNCCSTTNNVVDCNNPVAEAFDAPAPTDLSSTFTIPASTSTATSASSPLTPSSSTTSSITTTTTPTGSPSSASSSSSLSTGAQAGIGVGIATAGLALIALAALLLRRHYHRRRLHHDHTSPLPPPSTGSALPDARQSQTYRGPAWQALSQHPPSHAPYHAAAGAGGGGTAGGGGIDEWVTSQVAAGGLGGGGGGAVLPKSELPAPERGDSARYGYGVFGRSRAGTGMDAFELASNEVRRELGIMP